MTYCPKCGTANREGSRFCNQCGELLGTEKQAKCPKCGTLNPGQNLRCSNCGAQLDGSLDSGAGPRADSVPTKADADDRPLSPTESKEEMPPWLRNLGATVTPEDREESATLEESTEIPEWLWDLRASMPAESIARRGQAAERSKVTEPPAEPPPTPGGQQVPPSLSEAEEPEDRLPEPPQPTARITEDEEEPDWMAKLQSAATDGESLEMPATSDADEEAMPNWPSRLEPTEAEVPRQKGRPVEWPSQEPAKGAVASMDDEPAPDWLDMAPFSDMEDDLESELPAFDAEDEDSLDWLAELIPPPGETKDRAGQWTSEPDEEQVPDWLAEIDGFSREAGTRPETAASEAEGADAPAWFAEPQGSGVGAKPARETPASEPEQIPGWLTGSQAAPSGAEAEVETGPETEETLPAWDAGEGEGQDQPGRRQPSASKMETEYGEPFEEEGTEEIPDQDSLFRPSSIIGPEIPPPVAEEVPSEAEGPAWLADLQAEGVEEATVEIEATDWIVPSEPSKEEGELERADIPAWLVALKPPELREEGEPDEPRPGLKAADKDTGLLSGIEGILPIEMIIAQPRAASAVRIVEASIAETDSRQLFGEIVSRAPEAAPRQIVPAPARQPKMIPRWILYLTLILVVSLPLLLPEPLLIRTIEPAPAATDLYNAIETLDSEATVLVSFDYDPTTSGEMDVIGQALVGHLMDRGAKVVAMSLLPAGPATAQPLLDGLAAERPDYEDSYGQRYVNLGYLPGQAMAVRLVGLSPEMAFASDFQGVPLSDLPVMEGLASADDFDLILELAARQDSVRWWIEQASMPYSVPLGAGLSAPVAPLVQPYYETDPPQLVGLIGGVPGAITYQALQSSQRSPAQPAVARLDSQMAGQLLLVLVLLVGNGIFLLQRGARR